MRPEAFFDDVRGKHLLVALSGGADSVALLYMLCEQREALGLRISAAHLHHGIRGSAADGDAQFCRELCGRLNVAYIEGFADIPGIARAQGLGLETAARNERHAFLQRCMEQSGAELIALAHHMDDQAETVLMHLLRGAGVSGVCGMRRMSGVYYRPLLGLRKAGLMQYLAEKRIGWREDATNAVSDNPRNALRLHVLPEIEKSYPRAAEAIARFARLAQTEDDYIERIADDFLSRRLERGPYGLRLLLEGCDPSAEEAVLRRALRRICPKETGAAKLDGLIALCRENRGKLEISGECFAEKTPSALYLLRKSPSLPAAVPLQIPGETTLPGVCRITAEIGNFEPEPDNENVEVLDADALKSALLRTRRTGDRFHPLGSPGERLLSDVLTDKKLDRPLRDVLPLIACGNRILWTGGAGIAHEARIQNQTMRRVRITLYKHTGE